jgi:hypothetical protein
MTKDDKSLTESAAMMELTAIPHIAVTQPEVSVYNGTLTVYGIVDAFWKRAYLGDVVKFKFPHIYVENALTVIPPREGDFPPEQHPVKEPEIFRQSRARLK